MKKVTLVSTIFYERPNLELMSGFTRNSMNVDCQFELQIWHMYTILSSALQKMPSADFRWKVKYKSYFF